MEAVGHASRSCWTPLRWRRDQARRRCCAGRRLRLACQDRLERRGKGAADRHPFGAEMTLSGVDDVPWDRLHHAYGTAGDVPDLLRALRSPNEQRRSQAHYRLRGNIYHQGTRWEASSHAVPFLVELAADPGTPRRALVVQLVRIVGLGDARDEDLPFQADDAFRSAKDATDAQVARVVAVLYDDERDLEQIPDEIQIAVDARWRRDCYQSAAKYLATYRAWLADNDAEVGARAAELLAWFPADQTTVAALVNVPSHAMIRASANLTLAHLRKPDQGVDSCLAAQLGSQDVSVRRTAAVALAYRLGRSLPGAAAEVLTEPPTRKTYPAAPGWYRPLDGFVALARRRAGR
ncbi:MAG: hypothetical protein J2P15_08735 [Micromonosporaceae bacterium]|nr:hypothetical protein [Micromonosporaceae bacterium]